jgi:hypothetical protein
LKHNASAYEDSITINCWIKGNQGDIERESNRGENMIKVQYIHVWNSKAKPPLTLNIQLKYVGQEGKTDPV